MLISLLSPIKSTCFAADNCFYGLGNMADVTIRVKLFENGYGVYSGTATGICLVVVFLS